MQPGSLRESQVFLSLINLWATEVIPNPYFIWLLSHKCHSFWGETEVQEQPWQFLWRNFFRLLIRLTIQCRREAWLGELMGHVPQKTKGARQSYAGCWGERSGLHPLWHSKGSGSPWGLLLLKACKVTGGPHWGTGTEVTPRETGMLPIRMRQKSHSHLLHCSFLPIPWKQYYLGISMIYCEIWSRGGCHKFNILTLFWLLQEQGDCKEKAQLLSMQ